LHIKFEVEGKAQGGAISQNKGLRTRW
jgi:hypothetical protein